MIGVLSNAKRHEQMAEAILHGFPMLKKKTTFSENKVSIVCYGPSLLSTWRRIPREQSLITVSGAHDFLADRNIQPTWHVEIDPRPHKPQMLRNPRQGTSYLMASVCHPDFWTILRDYNVQLWHLINDEETVNWVEEHHPEGRDSMIGGGSTVGQRAMNVAAALGFRRFDVYGMDCSFDLETHAGAHTGERQRVVRVQVGRHYFKTTPQLLQAAREMEDFLWTMDAEVHFHGHGLMQETARLIQKRKGNHE